MSMILIAVMQLTKSSLGDPIYFCRMSNKCNVSLTARVQVDVDSVVVFLYNLGALNTSQIYLLELIISNEYT